MYSVTNNNDSIVLLALRLVCLTIVVASLMMHVRSVRVFRWEQSVSGGLLVTYTICLIGLALCAGIEQCGGKALQLGVRSVYGIRLLIMAIVVILMSLYFRSLRMIRWDRSYTGIALVANVAGTISLSLCVGKKECSYHDILAYLGGVGAVIMAINAFTIWRRWQRASDITRVVADLLGALGVQINRQVYIKTSLSAAASIFLLMDFTFTMIKSQAQPK